MASRRPVANIHSNLKTLDVQAGYIAPLSRNAGTVDGPAIDLSLYYGPLTAYVETGSMAASATLDAKWMESSAANLSNPTDVASGAATQLLAANGNAQETTKEIKVRDFTKRYVFLRTVVANAAVSYGVTVVGHKRQTSA